MFFDPLYWVIIGIGLVLSFWATTKVKTTFAHYSQFRTRSGLSGADVARDILRDNRIFDVRVERGSGHLSDHYNPFTKTLRLSEPVFDGNHMAAFGVAAHEVGHAIQHAQGYIPLKLRSAWVPIANFGGGFSMLVLILAAMMGGVATATGEMFSLAGVILFGTVTFFTLLTLPVEFDASRRALLALQQGEYATPEELAGARKVLQAAALTYVAAFVTSLLTLLYWAYRLGLIGRRR